MAHINSNVNSIISRIYPHFHLSDFTKSGLFSLGHFYCLSYSDAHFYLHFSYSHSYSHSHSHSHSYSHSCSITYPGASHGSIARVGLLL